MKNDIYTSTPVPIFFFCGMERIGKGKTKNEEEEGLCVTGLSSY